MTPEEQYGEVLCFTSVVFLNVGLRGHYFRPLGGILLIHASLERLHGLENVTEGYIHEVVSNKWVNYPFNTICVCPCLCS